MSTQLHKNFVDKQIKLLLKSYADKKIRLITFCKCLELKEADSLNYWMDIKKIQITFLSSITEERLIERLIKLYLNPNK